MINSNQKGKRGERQWRDCLRERGYEARRGQQFAGSPDSPDVICTGLGKAHFEVKVGANPPIRKAMLQALVDTASTERIPIVATRQDNDGQFLVTMQAMTFFDLLAQGAKALRDDE